MSKMLIIGEIADGKLNSGAAKVVAAAKGIGGDIVIAMLGSDVAGPADAAAKVDGVRKVLKVASGGNDNILAATFEPQIADIAQYHSHVMFDSQALDTANTQHGAAKPT